MLKSVFLIVFIIVCFGQSFGQLISNAGSNITICYNNSVTLGGNPTASGGRAPYTYQWEPSDFLNSTSISNPVASSCIYFVQYTLTVTDGDGNSAASLVYVNVDRMSIFNAGVDTGFCYGQQAGVTIGSALNNNTWHTFNWLPVSGLDNPSAANPFAAPAVTTTYTLSVINGICPDNISQVTVNAYSPPIVNAGADTTIEEGQYITLKAIGGSIFWWQPDYHIKYMTSANADVWPLTTTTYTLYSEDEHGCFATDDITVNVKNSNQLFFYSAFTPNNDGDNDIFYIGNLEKFPDNSLKIYNRYGKLIYSATNYANNWNGTYLGEIVPTGTYFYILNDGIDKTYKGSVTILR